MNQIEIDIAEFLLLHNTNLKPIIKVADNTYKRYKNMVETEYEEHVLTVIKNSISSSLKDIDFEIINSIVDKEFVIRVLGPDFLKYNQ